jgi:spore germination cell wall hydrolase CwlJ-like protein
MLRFYRAAAFAAAVMVPILGITFHATPSLAWQIDAPAVPVPAVIQTLPEVPTSAPATPVAVPEPAPPAAEAPRTLAEAMASEPAGRRVDAELECLAGAVYFEAKGEPLKGQLGVARVILNRTRSGRFPATACGVVKQRGQFSFVRGGRFPAIARGSAAWRTALSVARAARDGHVESPAGKALFFHARSVSPGWRGVTQVAAIGNHVFYR